MVKVLLCKDNKCLFVNQLYAPVISNRRRSQQRGTPWWICWWEEPECCLGGLSGWNMGTDERDRAGICGDPHGAERPLDQDDIHGPEAQGVAAGSRDRDGGNDIGREDDREAVETQLKTWKYVQEAERQLTEAEQEGRGSPEES